MKEVWKDIEGFNGRYQVSSFGRVRVVKVLSQKHDGNDIMHTHLRDGYEILGLMFNGKQKTFSVHKLVATHFVPNPNNYHFCYHKDGNRRNNNKDNLAWGLKPKNVLGVGSNDVDGVFSKDNTERKSYKIWEDMLSRCYHEKFRHKNPTYSDCEVCEEWKTYSNFKTWFDDPNNGYKKGYQLDKDIIKKGNRLYSPETCCFVPLEINTLFTKNNKKRGSLPIGVGLEKSGRYRAKIQPNGKVVSLGTYETIEEAFAAYKEAKEKRIKDLSTKYYNEGKITKRVYDAMQKYVVEITD